MLLSDLQQRKEALWDLRSNPTTQTVLFFPTFPRASQNQSKAGRGTRHDITLEDSEHSCDVWSKEELSTDNRWSQFTPKEPPRGQHRRAQRGNRPLPIRSAAVHRQRPTVKNVGSIMKCKITRLGGKLVYSWTLCPRVCDIKVTSLCILHYTNRLWD